jgi:hypothetical protein
VPCWGHSVPCRCHASPSGTGAAQGRNYRKPYR